MEITNEQWLNLKRNDKSAQQLTENGETKLQYFQISLPPREDGGKWKPIMACWKSKKTEGVYSCKLEKGVKIIIEETND